MPKLEFPDALKPATWKSKKGALPAGGDLVDKLLALKTKHDAVDWKPFDASWAAAAADVAALEAALDQRDKAWKAKVAPLKVLALGITAAIRAAKEPNKPGADASKAMLAAVSAYADAIDAGPAELKKAADAARPALEAKAAKAAKDAKEAKDAKDEPVDEAAARLVEPKRVLSVLQQCQRKPDQRVQFAFVDGSDKAAPLLAMHLTATGKSMFDKLLKLTDVKAGSYGAAWVEGKVLKLQPGKAFSGLPKKLRPPLKTTGFRVAKIVIVGDDGKVVEQDEEPRDEAGFADRLKGLVGRVAGSPAAARAKALLGEATEHAKRKEWEPAHARLDEAEDLLADAAADDAPPSGLSPAMAKKLQFEEEQFAKRQRATADAQPPQKPAQGEAQPQPDAPQSPPKSSVGPNTMARRVEAANKDFVTRRAKEVVPALSELLKAKGPEAAALRQTQAALVQAINTGRFDVAAERIEQLEAQMTVAKQRGEAQKTLAGRLQEVLGRVKKTSFPDGAADRFAKEKLSSGKHFDAFLKALKTFEASRTRADLDAMVASAQAYIGHVAAMPEKERGKSDRPRKVQICETQLKLARHWKLGDEFEQLGPPPWDFAAQNRAGGLYAKMLFEEGDKPGRALRGAEDEEGGEAGVTAAWWVDEVQSFGADQLQGRPGAPTVRGPLPADQVTKSKKRMIFKPMDGEGSELPGFDPGMSAPREILAKVLGDQIALQSGVDTGVCPTFLVAMDNERLDGPDGKPDPTKPAQRVGSVQQLAENDGSFGELAKAAEKSGRGAAALMASVPRESFDRMVVLDMVMMNLDRHAGNVLVKDRGNGQAELIPIDHGFCFPDRDALRIAGKRVGPEQNELLGWPQAQQPFGAEAQAMIAALDPDATAQALKAARDAMAAQSPQTQGTISDEAIEISRRCQLFLKRAAPQLTPAEIASAHVYHQDELLDAKPEQLDAAIASVIAKVKKRSAEIEGSKGLIAIDTATPEKALNRHRQSLKALGWNFTSNELKAFHGANPGRVARILRGRIVHPAAQQRLDARVRELGGAVPLPAGFADRPVEQRLQWLDAELRKLGKKVSDAAAPQGAQPPRSSAAEQDRLLKKYPEAARKKLAQAFEAFRPVADDKRTPDERQADLAEDLAWVELLEAEGGIEACARYRVALGSTTARQALLDLREAKALEQVLAAKVDTADDAAIAAEQRRFVAAQAERCRELLPTLRVADARAALEDRAKEGHEHLKAGDLDRAQAVLEPLRREIEEQAQREAEKVASIRADWNRFDEGWRKLPDGPARTALAQKFGQALQDGVEPAIAKGQFDAAGQFVARLLIELERARLGDASPVAKWETQVARTQQLLAQGPGDGQADQFLKIAAEALDKGDLNGFISQVTLAQQRVAEIAMMPVRDVLADKKRTNKAGVEAFWKRHKPWLDSGLAGRLQSGEVVLDDLFGGALKTMLDEAKRIPDA